MRHFLISALLLSLVAGCSSVNIGPHRIDVQQGNALDQENVARLKPGLNRSQVRYLLGTPLVVDPFRTDRWDYVYMFYKAGKLAEQKHISLFFDGDTLVRIEGDLPEPAPQPPAVENRNEPQPAPAPAPAPAPQPVPAPQSAPTIPAMPRPAAEPVTQPDPVVRPAPMAAQPAPASVAPESVVAPLAQPAVPHAESASRPAAAETSIVAPLSSPKVAPAYANPRPPAELSLQPETDVAQVRPAAIPPFPEPVQAQAGSNAPVLKSVNEWAAAWARRDEDAYLAAYDASFVPPDGDSRADWEKRRRLLLGVAKDIDLRIDTPSFERAADGTVTATFNQFYRSDKYRDAVVKQLRLAERDGRWLIVEEKVVSIQQGARP